MEEFLLPVAIPHAEVRADKEIPFLGSYLSSFLHVFSTSPQRFTAFLPQLLKICCRSNKKFSLQGIPLDNLSQGVSIQALS